MTKHNYDFIKLNEIALTCLPGVLLQLFPEGKTDGHDFIALNPTRTDRNLGSFRIRLTDCLFKDFSNGAGGKGAVNLISYVHQCPKTQAAKLLANMLRLNHG